ncbi:hypothetical protein HYX14_01570 [Candidatus Woesearchaeota archaeon]|nr:hypothetical protein [Candidatus Woesearchaeota archaeon]
MTIEQINDCFTSAARDEEKGRKHKGLLFVKPNHEEAKGFIVKAKRNLELCHLYKENGFEYKIPEEWFYTIYYCGLAILAMFGVESRSQRCTALFLRYVKNQGLIDYDDEFIERIMVYREKEEETDVDAREKGRYSSRIQMKEVLLQYGEMMTLCKKAIARCEEIVFSQNNYLIPPELLERK